jgi:hypothetical protein
MSAWEPKLHEVKRRLAALRIKSEDIKTSHDLPPIPIRELDWSARLDSYDASWEGEETGWVGGPQGHGATQEAAVNDLLDRLTEEADAKDWIAKLGGQAYKGKQ